MKRYFFKRILFVLLLFSCVACEEKDFYSTLEDDQAEMSSLRKEIDKLAGQLSCSDASDWKFTAIGVKACGGPTGYVAYSTKIDEALLLKKVALYTQKQKAFNVKWGASSDCMFLSPPKSISCVGGKPEFVY